MVRKTTEELWAEWETNIKDSKIIQIDFETFGGMFSVMVSKNNVNDFGYRAIFVEEGLQVDNITHSTLVGVVILAVEAAHRSWKAIRIINHG